MRENNTKTLKNRLLRILAVVLIVIITAAPEVAPFAVELFVLLDALGAELFLLCFALGVRLYVKMLIDSIRSCIERLDPYFFIPARYQIIEWPGISVHAIPGYISVYLFAVCFPSINADA